MQGQSKIAWTAAVAALVTLWGCNQSRPAGELKGAPAPGAAFQIALKVTPNPPKYNQETTFRVELRSADGKPVEGATVSAELVMPEMDMGVNKVQLADNGRGGYQGVGRFTMAGNHQIVVNAFKAGAAAKVVFPVAVEL